MDSHVFKKDFNQLKEKQTVDLQILLKSTYLNPNMSYMSFNLKKLFITLNFCWLKYTYKLVSLKFSSLNSFIFMDINSYFYQVVLKYNSLFLEFSVSKGTTIRSVKNTFWSIFLFSSCVYQWFKKSSTKHDFVSLSL